MLIDDAVKFGTPMVLPRGVYKQLIDSAASSIAAKKVDDAEWHLKTLLAAVIPYFVLDDLNVVLRTKQEDLSSLNTIHLRRGNLTRQGNLVQVEILAVQPVNELGGLGNKVQTVRTFRFEYTARGLSEAVRSELKSELAVLNRPSTAPRISHPSSNGLYARNQAARQQKCQRIEAILLES